MVITGVVRSAEAFDVYPATDELLRDRHVGLAESETDFRGRARAYLERTRPGCSDGFVDYVTARAWARHTEKHHRLELSSAALRRVAEFAATLTGDEPGAQQLRDAVAKAATRAGWTTPADTTDTTTGDAPHEQGAS